MILALNNISKSFGTDVILKNVSFNIEEKDKVAIVGVNGAGKSTLFKIITGELSHDDGEVICPKTTTIGYFSQTLEVDSSKTIYGELLTVFEPIMALEQEMRDIEVKMASSSGTALDDLMKKYSDLSHQLEEKNGYEYESRIRGVIKGLGFTTDESSQNIGELSGGQKTRVALSRILLMHPDLILLDEPTNHLDMESIRWLETFLSNYRGAVLIVSHDRYFMDKVVDHLMVFNGQGDIRDFPGNYSDYRNWKEAKEQKEKEAEKPQEEKTARVRLNDKRKMSFKEKREFEQLEKEIAELEAEKTQIEELLCSGTLSVDELTEKSKRLPEVNDMIDEKTMRWLELSEIEG